MKRLPLAIAASATLSLGLAPVVGTALAPSPPAAKAAAAMAASATTFLASLTPEQKPKAAFAWEDPNRVDWHFIPKARTGLPFKQMTPAQRSLAHALLKSGLSDLGYGKAKQIIELETVLREMEKDPVKRDPENYYVSVFGTPAVKGTWGWKFEGHHLSLNFTVVDGALLASTPAFMGANPGEVRQGPLKGRRVLRAEEDLGRELLMSFDEQARAKVVFTKDAPADIVTAAASKVHPLTPAGVPVAGFTPAQKELLRKLFKEYTGGMPPAIAADRMARLEKAGFDRIHFAWAGGVQKGDPHYYRLQGPTFLVEYDNTQNGANHVHTVWRDFEGDFGRDLLREHLRAAH